jgi:hypothetical protein
MFERQLELLATALKVLADLSARAVQQQAT